jgi:hypothetical protein
MEVVCAGNLVADIFANPIAALPAAGQLALTERFLFGAGGCATKTAAWAIFGRLQDVADWSGLPVTASRIACRTKTRLAQNVLQNKATPQGWCGFRDASSSGMVKDSGPYGICACKKKSPSMCGIMNFPFALSRGCSSKRSSDIFP